MAPAEPAHVVSTLNDLIATCRDGASGFRTAAEQVGDPILNAQFNAYAQQREMFAAELQGAVQAHGGNSEEIGSVAGAIDRGWVPFGSALTGLDDATILAECIRGEDAALPRYEHALEMGLPSDVRIVVERQHWAIQESRHHLHGLRGAHLDEGPRGAAPKRARERVARRRAATVRKSARPSRRSLTTGPKKPV